MSFSTCVSMHPKARKVDYGEDMFSNVPAVGTDIPGILHQNVVPIDREMLRSKPFTFRCVLNPYVVMLTYMLLHLRVNFTKDP